MFLIFLLLLTSPSATSTSYSLMQSIPAQAKATNIAISSANNVLVFATKDSSIHIYTYEVNEFLFKQKIERKALVGEQVRTAGNGKWVLVSFTGSVVFLYMYKFDLFLQHQYFSICQKIEGKVEIEISEDNLELFIGCSNYIYVYAFDGTFFVNVQNFTIDYPVQSLQVTDNQNYLNIGTLGKEVIIARKENETNLWKKEISFNFSEDARREIWMSQNEEFGIVSEFQFNQTKIYQIEEKVRRKEEILSLYEINSVVISSDGSYFITVGNQSEIYIRDQELYQPSSFLLRESPQLFSSTQISKDNKIIMVSGDSSLYIYAKDEENENKTEKKLNLLGQTNEVENVFNNTWVKVIAFFSPGLLLLLLLGCCLYKKFVAHNSVQDLTESGIEEANKRKQKINKYTTKISIEQNLRKIQALSEIT